MIISVDAHCHSVASTHAYSTVGEITAEAKRKGMEAIALTDHAIALPDSPHIWHFTAMEDNLPDYINGIRVFKGVEANIIDLNGSVDMPPDVLKNLDVVVASVHRPCLENAGTVAQHTQMYINVLHNPYVHILGHSGTPRYSYDHYEVCKVAKELGKAIEINNHTFVTRPNNVDICRNIAIMCAELGVSVVVNSDAHIAYDIGEVSSAYKLLQEIHFPEELIVNTSLEKFNKFFNLK